VASKPKYDLKASDRNRNRAVQIGLTAIVVIFAVALVAYIVLSADEKPTAGEAESIRVASAQLIKKDGTDEPKAVLALYEDFLCPACRNFEQQFGPTVAKLIDSGAVAADYYMVSILDRQGDGYSTRAANAAYCVAGDSIEAFRRFHAALYAQASARFPTMRSWPKSRARPAPGAKSPSASTRRPTLTWCRGWPPPPR
jgi:protein-disulfide isomerase